VHECNVSQVLAYNEVGVTPLGVDELMPMYTDECVKFISQHSHNGTNESVKPFLLVFTPDNTHVPIYASGRFKGKSGRGLYGDAVQELDWSIGRILDALHDAALAPSTFVAFTSDNG
jgi:arylsulfatase A-like enzyme